MSSHRPSSEEPGGEQTLVISLAGVAAPAELRLPKHWRFWSWATEAGPVVLSLRWGDTVLSAVETLGPNAMSSVHVNVGVSTYLSFLGPIGDRVFIFGVP